MAVANRDLIRAINRFVILHCIRENERISRINIAKTTGLSQASVTSITAQLLSEGLLLEKEAGKSMGGRRPVMLALNPEGAYAVGVYLSIRQVSVVLVNLEANIISDYSLPLQPIQYTPEAISDKIVQAVQASIWEADYSRGQIAGIGIAIPGLVDSASGILRFLPNYQWKEVHLRDMVGQRMDHSIYIENSANVLAVSEQWFGEGRGIDNFIVVTLENGVGLGIVINGQVYRGQRGIAGEFGHTIAEPDGPLCRCGLKGCLEAIVGTTAIVNAAKTAVKEKKWLPKSPDKITIEEVIEAAKKGNPVLQKIYARAGWVLGMGISNLKRTFNPAKIIISGSGVGAGKLIFDPMFAALNQYKSPKTTYDSPIVVHNWNHLDYARGAGSLVLQEVYKSPALGIIPTI